MGNIDISRDDKMFNKCPELGSSVVLTLITIEGFKMANGKTYDLLLKKDRKVRILESDISKEEAEALMAWWAETYNSDVYYDPVPELKIVPHKSVPQD
jgi:hypothetical protein